MKLEAEASNVSASSVASAASGASAGAAAGAGFQQQQVRKQSRFDEALHAHLTSLFQKSSQAVQAEIERLCDLNAQLAELCLDPTVALYASAAAALYHSLLAPLLSSALLARISGSSSALLSWPRLIRLLRERARALKRPQATQGLHACNFIFRITNRYTAWGSPRGGGARGAMAPPPERIGGASNAFPPPPPIFFGKILL